MGYLGFSVVWGFFLSHLFALETVVVGPARQNNGIGGLWGASSRSYQAGSGGRLACEWLFKPWDFNGSSG